MKPILDELNEFLRSPPAGLTPQAARRAAYLAGLAAGIQRAGLTPHLRSQQILEIGFLMVQSGREEI